MIFVWLLSFVKEKMGVTVMYERRVNSNFEKMSNIREGLTNDIPNMRANRFIF